MDFLTSIALISLGGLLLGGLCSKIKLPPLVGILAVGIALPYRERAERKREAVLRNSLSSQSHGTGGDRSGAACGGTCLRTDDIDLRRPRHSHNRSVRGVVDRFVI